MIKVSKLKWLFENRVILSLEQSFTELGFTYVKTKKAFIRHSGEFTQIVKLDYANNPISYDEDAEEIRFNFTLSTQLTIPKFEQWMHKKTKRAAFFYLSIESLTSYTIIHIHDFSQEDYIDIHQSRTYPISALSTHFFNQKNSNNPIYRLEELKTYKLGQISENLIAKSEFSSFTDVSTESPTLVQAHLLFYTGEHELAKKYYDVLYQALVDKLSKNSTPSREDITNLEEFAEKVQMVSGLSYEKIVERRLRFKTSSGADFTFTPNFIFKEAFRLDVREMDIPAYKVQVNRKGMVLLFMDGKKVMVLSAKGEILLETEVKYDDRLYNIGSYNTGMVEGTDDFYVNNYIIKADLSVLELPLMLDFIAAKKNKTRPDVRQITYSSSSEKYYILFPLQKNTEVWVYNSRGEYESKIAIEGEPQKIILEKHWIITSNSDKYNHIWDLEGKRLGAYEYAKSNDRIEFSKTYKYLFSFGYSAKSQLYLLPSEKAKTLWAHPTHLTGYKELLYGDTHYNFGVEVAKFSADEQYLVAGAYHGKYVLWRLPSLDRLELIPSEDAQAKLIHTIFSLKDGNWHPTVTRAEVVEFMGEEFLKNRSNHIYGIYFLPDDNLFITSIGNKMVLLWNSSGENLTFFDDTGDVVLHHSQYLTQSKDNELTFFTL